MSTQHPSPAANPTVMWLIHLAFMAAIFMYAIIDFYFIPATPSDLAPRLALVLILVMSAGTIMLGILYPRLMPPNLVPGPDDPPKVYLAKAQTVLVVTDACYESVAIFGLVGKFLGLSQYQAMSFYLLALIMLATQIQRLMAWIEEYRRRST